LADKVAEAHGAGKDGRTGKDGDAGGDAETKNLQKGGDKCESIHRRHAKTELLWCTSGISVSAIMHERRLRVGGLSRSAERTSARLAEQRSAESCESSTVGSSHYY